MAPLRKYRLSVGLMVTFALSPTLGAAQSNGSTGHVQDLPDLVCPIIETTARLNDLPVNFFTRLIWRESRLQPRVVGPLTRSGEHAEGIAQFMPDTAAERGLYEPFDPAEAVPKSAAFLAELRDKFGNLGLAAAAYNAGPQRTRDFLSGARDLPLETQQYVLAITNRQVEEWAKMAKEGRSHGATKDVRDLSSELTSSNCRDIVAQLKGEREEPVARWKGRTFPSWCKGLRHPNVDACGPVHMIDPPLQSTGLSHVRLQSARR